MPWNNQSGGGWKSGGGGGPWGQGPWGQGPSGGNQPDLEEILKRSQDKLKQVIPGSGLPGPVLLLIGALVTAVVCFYAFTFTVNPDEQALVLRFGRYDRWEAPGLHFRLPYPIEEVRREKVTVKRTIEVGFRSSIGRTGQPTTRSVQEEGLMLTGDENVVDVPFVVYWRIRDAEKFLFRIQNPEQTVKDVAESAMREVVGRRRFDDILTAELGAIRVDVQKLMQETLDTYNSGIIVDEISLQRVFPPQQVGDSFRDVQAAKIDLETLKNEAEAYASKVVPEARGEADRMLAQASAYREQVVAEATGSATRFLKVYDEYRKAPEVTRQRLFLETMERVYSSTDKVIIDGKSGPGVLPYLPLNDPPQQPKRKEGTQ